ncbi:Rv3235 family protein [Kineococcus glutinatus]|uniref:Energy transducer TonB n=1 Tax=Kineococcus glutinatus TaxID=1070872 RepID=A0ABP9HJ21_9ACTN
MTTAPIHHQAPALHTTGPVRRVPVPVCDPPLAGEPGAATSWGSHVSPGQGVLAISLGGPRRGFDESFAAPQPTTTRDLPATDQWCRRYVQVLLEVLAGQRPATQLLRWSSTDVYAALQKRAALSARLRLGTAPTRPPAVLSLRSCAPRDGVSEAAAVVRDGGRVRAVALRLEGWDGRWRVTALEMG